MFKLAKWSFERGVKHERMRIKKLAAEFQMNSKRRYKQFDFEMRNGKNPDLTKHDIEIDQRVSEVLGALIHGHDVIPEYVPRPAPIDQDEP